MEFVDIEPTLENYWRSIILFGRNSASYKFALAKSLIDLAQSPTDLIGLDELAEPFSRHLCEHLSHIDKQGTAPDSNFLKACREYNAGQRSKDQLISATTQLGFTNVIDAFHNVNNADLPIKFFVDERKASKGIRLTEDFFKLVERPTSSDLGIETESRWRLVETAWNLNISHQLITVHADNEGTNLFTHLDNKRIGITSSRDALNGYQKSRCFYCFDQVSVTPGSNQLADVDHFFPHILKSHQAFKNIDGVWNLVLACKECNRGENGKFAKLPDLTLLSRLQKRNEYLITSHHPLRETLMQQTGTKVTQRTAFLQASYNNAKAQLIHNWKPEPKNDPLF